jgi:hypothetical protein
MKVDELRTKLLKLNQEEMIRIAVEFYKLIPKSKKEDSQIDELINNPAAQKAKTSAKSDDSVSLEQIEMEVNTFIVNAKAYNYLSSNKVIAKADRPKWRFLVKAWFKQLTNPKNRDWDAARKAKVLKSLYNLMCEYGYFSSEDNFQSIGIPQDDFLGVVLQFDAIAYGKMVVAERGVELIVNNSTSRDMSYSTLMKKFIEGLTDDDLNYKALEKAKAMWQETDKEEKMAAQNRRNYDSSASFYRKYKQNHLAELGFRIYANLSAFKNAIEFFNAHYIEERDKEVQLYILISLLLGYREKEFIEEELAAAEKSGMRLRPALVKMLKEIREKDYLPQYM